MNYQALAEAMINNVKIIEHYKEDPEYKENMRKLPFYSELKGMELTLKLLEIDFDYTFDLETMKITAITIKADDQEYVAI